MAKLNKNKINIDDKDPLKDVKEEFIQQLTESIDYCIEELVENKFEKVLTSKFDSYMVRVNRTLYKYIGSIAVFLIVSIVSISTTWVSFTKDNSYEKEKIKNKISLHDSLINNKVKYQEDFVVRGDLVSINSNMDSIVRVKADKIYVDSKILGLEKTLNNTEIWVRRIDSKLDRQDSKIDRLIELKLEEK